MDATLHPDAKLIAGHHRRSVVGAQPDWRQIVDASPVATYLCDAGGRILHYNQAAAVVWGREPEPEAEFWCGSWKLFQPDGRECARELGAMAQVLLTRRPVSGMDMMVERPDGSRLHLTAHAQPLFDRSGQLVGASCTLVDVTAQKSVQARLWESDLTWRLMFDCSPVAQMMHCPFSAITSVNQRFVELTGYSRAEMVGNTVEALGLYVMDELGRALLQALRQDGSVDGMQAHLRCRDGRVRVVLMSSCPVSMDGAAQQLHSFVDITDYKEQEAQLKLASRVFAQGREGLIVTDAARNIIMVNRAFSEISGYELADVLGRNPRMLASGRQDKGFYRAMWDTVAERGEWRGEIWNRHKDGTVFPEQLMISVVRDDQGQISNYVGTFTDMSEQNAARARINWLSHFDALTGLPNRATLAERCNQTIQSLMHGGTPMSMVMVGIDRFMGVNDSLGHAAGDELLQLVAQRVAAILQSKDVLARIGGDEFVLLLPEQDGPQAQDIAMQMMESISRPCRVAGNDLSVTASVGIACYPAHGQGFQALFQAAEVAMHRAKELGRNRQCLFEARMLESTLEQATLVAALRTAVSGDQLQLHYQPFVDMQTGAMNGMEALLRWRHPELGSVSPARFIPAAEKSGLIMEIGSWVLRRACQDMRRWLDDGLRVPRVSVNLSPVQFRNLGLLEEVASTLREFEIEPGQLCIEVTEGALMEDVGHSEKVLRSLRDMGVHLSLDDFGTGYSSLSYLKLFPFDKVKIDQSFVHGLSTNPHDAVIARVVISMAHGLGLRVIAEGVESEAQAEFMRANMCDEIQGYLFSRPIPVDQFEALVREDRRLPPHLMRIRQKIRTLLLVDDDPRITGEVSHLLRYSGYRILTAGSGLEGLDVLAGNAVDVIVSDQRMPGMNGIEFLRRAKELYPDTVRIVLSGCDDLQFVASAINEGAVYRFMTKPWVDDELDTCIEEAFEHKDLADENRILDLKVKTANFELETANRRLREVLGSQQHRVADGGQETAAGQTFIGM